MPPPLLHCWAPDSSLITSSLIKPSLPLLTPTSAAPSSDDNKSSGGSDVSPPSMPSLEAVPDSNQQQQEQKGESMEQEEKEDRPVKKEEEEEDEPKEEEEEEESEEEEAGEELDEGEEESGEELEEEEDEEKEEKQPPARPQPPPPQQPPQLPKPPKWISSLKWLSAEMLAALSRDEMRALIEGLRRADGSFAHDQNRIFTSGVLVRDQLMQALLHCGYSPCALLNIKAGSRNTWRKVSTNTFIHRTKCDQLSKEEQANYKQVNVNYDFWEVSWTDESSGAAKRSSWPSMSCEDGTQRLDYDAAQHGDLFTVAVQHHSKHIFAQRAYRNALGTVTKQSRPIIVGCKM